VKSNGRTTGKPEMCFFDRISKGIRTIHRE